MDIDIIEVLLLIVAVAAALGVLAGHPADHHIPGHQRPGAQPPAPPPGPQTPQPGEQNGQGEQKQTGA